MKNGNRVVFDEWGSFIESKESGDRLWLEEHEGVYVLDALVAPAAEAKKRINQAEQGFQGRRIGDSIEDYRKAGIKLVPGGSG